MDAGVPGAARTFQIFACFIILTSTTVVHGWNNNNNLELSNLTPTFEILVIQKFLRKPEIKKYLGDVINTGNDEKYMLESLNSLEEQNVPLPFHVRKFSQNIHDFANVIPRSRRETDEELPEEEELFDESRMFAVQVKIPDLPNVDIGRVLELWEPNVKLNSYEKTARKQIIDYVRTKSFQYGLTQLDTTVLFSTYKITRGQFVSKLMKFIRKMSLEPDVLKASELVDKLVERSEDDSNVEEDVLDDVDEMDEKRGKNIIREALAAVLEDKTPDNICKSATELRQFIRTPDLRFGLVFRGLHYAFKELNNQQMLTVILLRINKFMKTTLRPRHKKSISKLLQYFNYNDKINSSLLNPTDLLENLDSNGMNEQVKYAYNLLIASNAVEELKDLRSYKDILFILQLGFDDDINLAILLRTMTVQFMMATPPDKELAESAQLLYEYLFPDRPLRYHYNSPKLIIETIRNFTNEKNQQLPTSLRKKVTETLKSIEIYGPIISTDFFEILQMGVSTVELMSRVFTLFRMRVPYRQLQIWANTHVILEHYNVTQDYEISLPSDYNFADEFAIATRMSNIQDQFKINIVSQIINNKAKMTACFHSMRILRQFPTRVRVILILRRILHRDYKELSQSFKNILPSIIEALEGDNDIQEMEILSIEQFKDLYEFAFGEDIDTKEFHTFKIVRDFLIENPQYVQAALREVVLLQDYSYKRAIAMIFVELLRHRTGKMLPPSMDLSVRRCLAMLGVEKEGDEEFIEIKYTLEKIVRRLFAMDEEKITQNILEARETLLKLINSARIDLRYVLRDVRLYKYSDRKKLLILLFRISLIQELWSSKEHAAIKILINHSGLTLKHISQEGLDIPEEIETLLEEALPFKLSTKFALRSRVILIRALETGAIDRRIAYDGIQCHARGASSKEKLVYIIRNIWPIRADVSTEISRSIHEIKRFAEIKVDNDTDHALNVYSFDFQEVFDDVIPPYAAQDFLKAKEFLYRDIVRNTGRYEVTLKSFIRGKQYPIVEIADKILETIIENKSPHDDEQRIGEAAEKLKEFLDEQPVASDRQVTIEELLAGNAQDYVA